MIYRAYDRKPDPILLRTLGRQARRRGIFLLVAGDDSAARCLCVGGMHLPEYRLKTPSTEHMFDRSRRARPDLIVTAAAHSEHAIIAAARAGVDAVLISPVFPTESHPGAPVLGIVRFARLATVARRTGLDVYALGGMTSELARRLRGTGTTGIAGISLW